MDESNRLDPESGAVRTHLEIMQGVISRMADNSRSCKVWCVTLVAAVLFLSSRTDGANQVLIALAPAVLFWFLDSYYLSLERAFRGSYSAFAKKVREGEARVSDLYVVAPSGSVVRGVFWGMFCSVSVWPFYAMVAATVGLAWFAL